MCSFIRVVLKTSIEFFDIIFPIHTFKSGHCPQYIIVATTDFLHRKNFSLINYVCNSELNWKSERVQRNNKKLHIGNESCSQGTKSRRKDGLLTRGRGGRAAVAFEFQSRALLHFDVYIMWPLHDAQRHRRRRCCLRNAAVTRTSLAVTQRDMTGRSVRTTGPWPAPGRGRRNSTCRQRGAFSRDLRY